MDTQHRAQVFPQSTQAPLVARVGAWTFIVYELFTLFIHTVVCQVDEVVGKFLWIICVFFSCKSDKAFFMNVELERVNAGDENIETQVKLKPSNQEWVVNVLLGSMITPIIDGT